MTSRTVAAPTTMPLPAGVSRTLLVKSVDPYIAAAVAVLLGVGTVMVYSASAVRASAAAGTTSGYLVNHLVSIGLGLALLALAVRTPVERWSKHAYLLLAISVALLIALYIPGLGRRVNGALRWLQLGPLGFQPAELAKLAVVVYLAHSLAKKRERVASFSVGFVPHVIVTSAIVLLILMQPDFGTSVIIFATLGLMMFVAGTKIGYLLLAAVLAIPVGYHYISSRPHAWQRLLVFLEPEAHKTSIGYQIWESLVSFGSGGLAGVGLGQGQQKLFFLPEAHTDFIFAVVGEELGFIGVVLVVAMFTLLVGRGLRVAWRGKVRFPMFLGFGLCAWLGVQALTNMMVVVALLPTKGLTLPLVSFGRSSMIITLLAVGILLRISAEERSVREARSEAQ